MTRPAERREAPHPWKPDVRADFLPALPAGRQASPSRLVSWSKSYPRWAGFVADFRPQGGFLADTSYAHKTPERDRQVREFAQGLRDAGIRCEIDIFVESPPEGWPRWCSRQVQECDFCIIVCTETYARRFAGQEAPGKGKGATWEAKLIRQCMYSEQDNTRFIPVVLSTEDIHRIPLELQDVTYYDLSRKLNYERLYLRVTRQRELDRHTVGFISKNWSRLDPRALEAVALLHQCPKPLPLEVVARCTGHDAAAIRTILQEYATAGVVAMDCRAIRLVDRSVEGCPATSRDLMGSALKALLDFISRDNRKPDNRMQVINAVALIRALDDGQSSVEVSRAFGILQSLLKSLGNKRLVLEIARASIRASKEVSCRGTDQVKDEALATICGVSWVYQRTQRLNEARVEAESSLALGRCVDWERNTAFCMKCLGRLRRLEAEDAQDETERVALLGESVGLLQDAVRRFQTLALELEVGDCYSLLARTHLACRNMGEAWAAILEAERRLVEPDNKDYLDLLITRGDFAAFRDLRAAESEYTKVADAVDESDAQTSEIVARACHQRGLVRAKLGDETGALADFHRAARIWDELEDPSADAAHWEIERRDGLVRADAESRLAVESLGVRVRVARLARQRRADRGAVAARRGTLPLEYLRDLIKKAKSDLSVERPKW